MRSKKIWAKNKLGLGRILGPKRILRLKKFCVKKKRLRSPIYCHCGHFSSLNESVDNFVQNF